VYVPSLAVITTELPGATVWPSPMTNGASGDTVDWLTLPPLSIVVTVTALVGLAQSGWTVSVTPAGTDILLTIVDDMTPLLSSCVVASEYVVPLVPPGMLIVCWSGESWIVRG
jgi:hypothetical protein